MTVRSPTATPSLDWRHIAALSSSLIAHLVAAALIAIPLAIPLRHDLPKSVEVILNQIKPPPPLLPMPPEPQPPRHVKTRHQTQVPAFEPAHPIDLAAENNDPAPSPVATMPISGADSSGTSITTSGESRTLAYAEPLNLKYPLPALRQRAQGTVMLRVLVDANGVAQRIEIERSSGHPALDAAAREAILHTRFRPVLQDGHAIPAWGIVPIAFRLDRT